MLYTVGHSNRTLEQFIEILNHHNIQIIADVRGGSAGSRTFPHFNKENLAISLPAVGIKYIHFPDLGGRRGRQVNANQYTNGEWRLPAFKNYADYAQLTDKFKTSIKDLIELQHDKNVAYMCSEAVPWRCHRTIITDYMILVHKLTVTHIVGKQQTINAVVNKHAMLENNNVIYPKQFTYDLFE